MQSSFTKIPAFNHFNQVGICFQIVNIYDLADILTFIFSKNVLFTIHSLEVFGVFSRRN